MKRHKVTLYVQSVKTVTGTEEWGRWGVAVGAGVRGGYRLLPDYKVYSEAKYERILPGDQKKVLEMVKEVAHKYGFEVEAIDVAMENVLDRLVQEEVKKIRVFPTLITDSGERIEGDVSKEQIESLLAKAT